MGGKNMIKYTITVYVPGSICNFKCSYCYVSQALDSEHLEKPIFHYSIEQMLSAFQPNRLGGIANVIVIGRGETLIPDEVIPFVHGLLDMGHYVEVVTNLSLSNKVEELLCTTKSNLKRLLVKGSLHWVELKRLNLVDVYFNNMKKVLEAGASGLPFFVVCDEYMPYLEEIKNICEEKLGTVPQCSPCLKYDDHSDFYRYGKIRTQPECTDEFVNKIDILFHSKIFDLCVRFLRIDPQKIFCYAGKWSFVVEMDTGYLGKCHNKPTGQNFYDLKTDIFLEPVACFCGISSCALQYDFIAQGLIPEILNIPTYGELIRDSHLIQDEFVEAMNFKYYDENEVFDHSGELSMISNIVNNRENDLMCLYQAEKEKSEVLCKKIEEQKKLIREYEAGIAEMTRNVDIIMGNIHK